jgi:hypothetical protein
MRSEEQQRWRYRILLFIEGREAIALECGCDRSLLFLLIGDHSFADKAHIAYNRC